jgi:hypothetical protein
LPWREVSRFFARPATHWFWLTPYSGLVIQTRDALRVECPGLRMRDVKVDRRVDDIKD